MKQLVLIIAFLASIVSSHATNITPSSLKEKGLNIYLASITTDESKVSNITISVTIETSKRSLDIMEFKVQDFVKKIEWSQIDQSLHVPANTFAEKLKNVKNSDPLHMFVSLSYDTEKSTKNFMTHLYYKMEELSQSEEVFTNVFHRPERGSMHLRYKVFLESSEESVVNIH